MANHFELIEVCFYVLLWHFCFSFVLGPTMNPLVLGFSPYLKGIAILGFPWKFQYFYQYLPLNSTWIPNCLPPPTPTGGCSWTFSQLSQPSGNFAPSGSLESSLLAPEQFRGKPWIWGALLSIVSFFFPWDILLLFSTSLAASDFVSGTWSHFDFGLSLS